MRHEDLRKVRTLSGVALSTPRSEDDAFGRVALRVPLSLNFIIIAYAEYRCVFPRSYRLEDYMRTRMPASVFEKHRV